MPFYINNLVSQLQDLLGFIEGQYNNYDSNRDLFNHLSKFISLTEK